uniref:Uncharacterized protein n=1 Tax=Meloidogyne hapla TaxID=6305 RepID=A0A1I8BZN7_MELHA
MVEIQRIYVFLALFTFVYFLESIGGTHHIYGNRTHFHCIFQLFIPQQSCKIKLDTDGGELK